MNTIWADFARLIYNVEVQFGGEGNGNGLPSPDAPASFSPSTTGSQTRPERVSYSGGTAAAQPSALAAAAAASGAGGGGAYAEGPDDYEPLPAVEQRRVDAESQVGRNDPCPCGSGKKYKHCHGKMA